MRHRIAHRKLNRTSEHRTALLRNMAQSLIEHGQVTTTLPKAKTLRPFIERLVTLAVKTRKLAAENDGAGSLRTRRRIQKLLGDRAIIPKDHRAAYAEMSDAHRAKTVRMPSGRRFRTGLPKGRMAFTAESVTHRLIETVAARFEDRPGGYTRLVRLAKRRLGDSSPLAVLQLVGDEEPPATVTKPAASARKRRADARYALAIKIAKTWGGRDRAAQSQGGTTEPSADAARKDSASEAGEPGPQPDEPANNDSDT
jgi:large subunit ribosomal protein L17